jgi:hypothetical protein
MKKTLLAAISLLFISTSFAKDGSRPAKNLLSPIVCYASNKSHKSFIKAPQDLKNASIKSANIIVDYVGFSDEARQAFQYAVDIWKDLIYSPLPIHVQANWISLDAGILGSTRPTYMVNNFDATQIWNCDYPIALAEKMLGTEINSENDFELLTYFNKDLPGWYLGTDGNCPANQYDFVSIVLHELAHGFAFTGNLYSDGAKGGYSFNSDNLPAPFDTHIVNRNGDHLVNTALFSNPSVLLNSNLISNDLKYKTELLNSYFPKLYAPSTWDDGSSIYHLDEDTYGAGTLNSLMTPYADGGEAVHYPGEYTLDMMYDMGWKCITIKHTKLKDVEFVAGPISFEAKIISDYDLDLNKIYLVYSSDNFLKRDSVLLLPTPSPDIYTASLSLNQNGSYNYFISASDVKNRRYVYPSNSPARSLIFKIGPDNEAPVVSYEPIKFLLESNPNYNVVVNATDNLGINSVKMEYFLNGGIVKSIELQNDSNDIYSGQLTFPIGSVKAGDLVSFRIVAVDASSNANIARLPVSGYNVIRIEGFKGTVDKYVNNFDSKINDFISDDFTIKSGKGFPSPALNTAHPYLSPDKDNASLNFTAILKYPVILKVGGKMSFDEIVLVEPGEPCTSFGSVDFYDYVIVEGSNDGGTTWKPLIDGYDSSSQSSWNSLFNSSFSGQNSDAIPTKDLFVKREFGLLDNGNFNAGETILIRFRLFSDPYSNGWGWIIDNLAIQDFGTAANQELISSGEIEFFPNPAKGRLNLEIQAKMNIQNLSLKVYSSSGVLVYNQFIPVHSNLFKTELDITNFNPGLYLFTVEPEKGQIITRKILIN